MGEIMLIARSPATAAFRRWTCASWPIFGRSLAVPGVAQVIPIGGEVRQYRVVPNVATMQALNVTPDQIEQAVTRFGTNTGGGFVDQYGREYLVRNVGLTKRLEDLANTVVAVRNGQPIFLKQVAGVDFAPRVKRGEAGYNGKPAVIISIQKQPAADTVTLTRKIEAALQDIQRTLPSGVTATNVQFRQATFIETSIRNVERVLLEAAVVVALILFVFLMNARATRGVHHRLLAASILVTVLVFNAFGPTINTMTLGGLAIAIGGNWSMMRWSTSKTSCGALKENRALVQPRPVLEVIAAASQEVRSGIVYATIIIVLVFVPLFATRHRGRLFAPLGIAYIVSILSSLLTSITVTPILSWQYLLSGRTRGDGTTILSCVICQAGEPRRAQLGVRPSLARDRNGRDRGPW
jgi:HME family heavy-metal exporter